MRKNIFKRTGNVWGFGVILLGRCRACRMYDDIFYPRILSRRCLLILMSRNTHASYLFTGFTYCLATCRIASMFTLYTLTLLLSLFASLLISSIPPFCFSERPRFKLIIELGPDADKRLIKGKSQICNHFKFCVYYWVVTER